MTRLNLITSAPRWLICLCLATGCQASAPAAPSSSPGDVDSPTDAGKTAPPEQLAISHRNIKRVKLLWQIELGSRGTAVAVSRRTGRVAAAAVGQPVKLYRYYGGASAGVSASCSDVLRSGISITQGKLVVVCQRALEIYDAAKMRQLPAPTLADSRATASHLVWPNLAVGHRDGVLRIYDLESSQVKEIPVPGPPIDVKALALSPDGKRLYVAWVQGSIWYWNLDAPEVPHPLVRHERESDALALNPAGTLLVEEGASKATSVWQVTEQPQLLGTIDQGSWVKRFAFSLDGTWLLRGGSHGLDWVETEGEGRIRLIENQMIEDVGIDDEGISVVSVDREGKLSLFTPKY